MNSPILQAELRHQRRSGTPIQRRWLRYLYRLALIAGVVVSALLFGFELLWALSIGGTGAGLFFSFSQLTEVLIVQILPVGILFPLVILLDFGLMLRTLLLASDAITREKQRGTWQILLLTGQSPRQIVVGKWGATILTLAPEYLLLAALRVGIIVYVGLERYRINSFYYSVTSAQWYYDIGGLPFDTSVKALLIGVGLITLFTFANLLFTAALGLLIAALRSGRRTGEQVAIAFALRTVLLVLPGLLLIGLGRQIISTEPLTNQTQLASEYNALGFSLLDNGTQVSAAALTAPRYALNYAAFSPPFYIQFFPPGVIPYALGYALLIGLVALGGAVGLARRVT